MEKYLLSLGLKVWEKKDADGNTTQKRIYINDLKVVGIEKLSNNAKRYKFTLYYDCLTNNFFSNAAGRSDEEMLRDLINLMQEEASKLEEVKEETTEDSEVDFIEANIDRFINDEVLEYNGYIYKLGPRKNAIVKGKEEEHKFTKVYYIQN